MKKIKSLYFLLTFGLLMTAGACDDDTLDAIDTNPNSPTDVSLRLLLPQVLTNVAFTVSGTDLAWYSSVFVEHTAGVHAQLQNADRRSGLNDNTMVNNSWTSIYAVVLQDLDVMIAKGSEGGSEAGNSSYVGIAKILKAYTLAVATDAWGRVPNAEALKGSADRKPTFDSQESIYNDIQRLLDEAIADLAQTPLSSPGNADMFYGGDQDKWTKVAWSLKARYYNRLSNIDPQGSATKALEAAANGFANATDNFTFSKFTNTAIGENPWFQESNDRSHHAVGKTFDDLLVSLNDPRRTFLIAPAPNSGQINPAPNGTLTNDQANKEFSDPTIAVLNATAPLPLMTYDELKFIEAEANLRLGNNADALTAFQEGVREAMIRQGINEAAVTDFLASDNLPTTAASLTLQDIIRQKYIAYWLFQPIEAFNDYRRTGFPTLNNPLGPAPRRFPYPQSELDANSENVPNVELSNGVWWDDGSDD
jgi:hypothetical protein